MDMQPLQAAPEASADERRRKNQQIVSRGARQKSKVHSTLHDDQDPQLLMMSSVNGEGDSVVGEFSSPSTKRLLSEAIRKHAKSSNSSRVKNQPTTKASSSSRGGNGMSSKITRALFRDRRPSHGAFSKMDSMASDDHGSHFRRSARSPFRTVQPRSMDFGLLAVAPPDEGPVASFDNASTHSGLAVESSHSPVTVMSRVKEYEREYARFASCQSPLPMPHSRKGSAVVVEEPLAHRHTGTGSNVSALSMGSGDFSAVRLLVPPTQAPPVRTMNMIYAGTIVTSTRAPSSVASSVSSLNYSESHASSSVYEHNNVNGASSLVGIKLASNKSEDTLAPPSVVVEQPISSSSSTSDNESISDLVQERVMERLEEGLEDPATNTSVCTAASSKKIPAIKPPPPLPPKPPRRNRNDSSNTSFHSAPASTLKQHEERLLQGGDFLNESSDSAPDCGGSVDLPLKLLHRLEAAQNDINLMANHHNQDPPLVMTSSFGSSTIASRRTISITTRQASSSTYCSNPYTALSNTEGLALIDTSLISTRSVPLVEDAEDEEEEDIILAPVAEQSHENATKLCYLYSQDKEFENSILSHPSASHIGTSPVLPADDPSPAKRLYRSDAIGTFLEQTGCSNDKCFGVMKGIGLDTAGAARRPPAQTVEGEADDGVVEEGEFDHRTLVSDEFLNLVTSGCTGAADPAAKEAMKEKLVALEAGWSGFRSQFHEKIQTLEESWQRWNLNSLMNFTSPSKSEPASETAKEVPKATPEPVRTTTPVEMGSTTVFTTPPSKPRPHLPTVTPTKYEEEFSRVELELVQDDDSVVIKSSVSIDAEQEIVLGVVRELARSKAKAAAAVAMQAETSAEEEDASVEKIVMGSTEHDVPLSLKNTLADISMIADSNNQSGSANSRGRSTSPHRPKTSLDCSREDSEGGKVMLDAAEWDPVDSSDTGEEDGEAQGSNDASRDEEPVSDERVQQQHQKRQQQPTKHSGFVLFKRKTWGKKKAQSPKSVLVEI